MEAHDEVMLTESMKNSSSISGKFTSGFVTVALYCLRPKPQQNDAICTDMTGYTGGVTTLLKTVYNPSTGSKPTDTSISNPTAPSSLPAKEEQVGYLAGLVALSCMLATSECPCIRDAN
jgi:hypothetical protein